VTGSVATAAALEPITLLVDILNSPTFFFDTPTPGALRRSREVGQRKLLDYVSITQTNSSDGTRIVSIRRMGKDSARHAGDSGHQTGEFGRSSGNRRYEAATPPMN
jgi:hypothetical protein